MRHHALTHSSFFEHMEEFGFLRDLEEYLPEDFTAVFEIARVLEDPDSPLARLLSPVMRVTRQVRVPETAAPGREWRPNRMATHGEEYEAALMRNMTDIKRILPHQYLLPDEIFLQRLARRSLWINIPVTPVIIPFGSNATEYSPDSFKQKVYLLLDTSSSMSSHHRIQMAKAVVYVFLKRNLAELGQVFFRTFDVDIGPMQSATDEPSLRRLIHHAMRLRRLGNGTAMERAILQAADDIRARSSLSGAEILIVTDGACHLDCDRIREALGESIRINTIKIGNADVYADERTLDDLAARGSSADHRTLRALEDELRRARGKAERAVGEAERRSARAHAAQVEGRLTELKRTLVERLRENYGREIEILSRVYVQVDDITADAIFTLRQSEIDELRELLAEVEIDFDSGIDADTLREAALLLEHVQMLLRAGGEAEQMRQLEEMQRRLRQMLEGVIDQPRNGAMTERIGRADMQDLRMMLHLKGGGGGSLLDLLRAAWRKLWRWLGWSPRRTEGA